MLLRHDKPCYLRITLFDDGSVWQQLSTHLLASEPIYVQLGFVALRLTRLLSTPNKDPTGWVCTTNWQTLFALPPKKSLTMHFVSPTAFSWGSRHFVIFPEPFLLWERLLNTWNRYSPVSYRVERKRFRESLLNDIKVTKCSLRTKTVYFRTIPKKGLWAAVAIALRRLKKMLHFLQPWLHLLTMLELGTKRRWGWDRYVLLSIPNRVAI